MSVPGASVVRNVRTARKATIRRASAAGRAQIRQLDAGARRELQRAYADARAAIERDILGAADGAETLRLAVLRELLGQVNEHLDALARSRNLQLEQAIDQAAAIGVTPWQGGAAAGVALNRVADEAAHFVRTFIAEDGLQLSDRLWRLDRHAQRVVGDAIQSAVIQGHSATRAVDDFLARGEAVPADIRAKAGSARADGVARAAGEALMRGEGNPYDNALRVFRTEINRAHGEAYQAAAFEHPDVVGVKFTLSPNHPRPDICDMHAQANVYGLGPGVYPKGRSPWPAHPNTLSFVEPVFGDEVSDEDRAGREGRMDWLRRQPPGVQEGVLGSRRKRAALEQGVLAEREIATPWRVLKQRYQRRGIDVEALDVTPVSSRPGRGGAGSASAAVDYVREEGQRTGWEHAYLYDTQTSEVVLTKTSRHPAAVEFNPSEGALMRDPQRAISLVHNHPSGSSLSGPDLEIGSLPGVRSVVAVAHDRGIYEARTLGTRRRVAIEHQRALRQVEQELLRLPEPPGAQDGHHLVVHLALEVMNRRGLIEYRVLEQGVVLERALARLGGARVDALVNRVLATLDGRGR